MTQALGFEAPAEPGICDWGWVAVGHRASEPADPSGGRAEAVVDERLGWCLAFDGLLDNGTELRRDLEDHFPFRSGTDAEVILAAYHRWGEHFVERLAGAFALALVDAPQEKVVLARDPQGHGLMYLRTGASRLRFASSLPGLLAAGDGAPSVAPPASGNGDGLRRSPGGGSPATAPDAGCAGISLLPAATVRVVDARGRMRNRDYAENEVRTRYGVR
jgi:asparagine synthase (glutamine-hydrolysing)